MQELAWLIGLGSALAPMVAGCSTTSAAPSTQPSQLRPVTLMLVGDSTVADYPPGRPNMGWGQALPQFLSPRVQVVNLAKGGRSSKSFIQEGLWDQAQTHRADFVLIQFGHNDCPGKGERSTGPDAEYPQYLGHYVEDSRRRGANPILVTPVARRKFDRQGKVRNDLLPYAQAMKRLALDRHVPVVDLNAASVALYERLGDEGSAYLSCSADDRTHFSPAGAKAMAELVARGLRENCPALAPYVRLPEEPR